MAGVGGRLQKSFPAAVSVARHPWFRVACVAGLCGCLPAAGFAQNRQPSPDYLIDVWQTENGLPENTVNAIAQTPEGYLWCGTPHGLARFDGVNFKVFNAQNAPQLGTSRIRQLFVDRGGALWIALFDGELVRFKAGQFTAFALPPRESTARTIVLMTDDKAGALWLTVEDGAVFRLANGQFDLVSQRWNPKTRVVFQVHGDAAGRPWATTPLSLSRIEQDKLVPVLQGKSGQYEFLCPSRSGGWWVQSGGRVRLWRDGEWGADAGEWVPLDRRVECSLEDRRGEVWVASLGKGLFCYSTNRPPRQITMREGLGSDLVRGLFEDVEGNLWVGTRAGGLNRVRPALFKTYGRKQGLATDLVTAIAEGESGQMWIGTDGDGVDRLRDNAVEHFSREQGLTGGHVRALLLDRQKVLWVGSWPGGLFRLEGARFVPVRDFSGGDMVLASLFEDSLGRLWLGQRTLNRLVRFERGVALAVDLPNPAPALDVTVVAEDATGGIWAGTDGNGLFCWKDGQCRRFTLQDGLPSNSVRALLAEPDGALWIGTVDGGLGRLKHGRFVACTTRDGLVDDVINYIADDGRGCLWFTSFQGIFRVSKAELNEFAEGARRRIQCVAFGKSDGLPALECPGGFQPAGCRTRDGRLWFPTIKGLVVVDPAQVPTNSVAPPVLIEEVLVDGVLVAGGSGKTDAGTERPAGGRRAPSLVPNSPTSLRIRPGWHRYEFRYTGLSFMAPEQVRFRHKLEGLDENWMEAGAQRTANYNHLSPGAYRFRVTACNQAGMWNEAGALQAFSVLPYFWQTWWFLAGSVLGLVGAVAGTVFFTMRGQWKRRLQRVELQLSVEQERARIARDIHDGVGANLTEIAWLAEVAEQDAADPAEVRAQARKISGTARQTVQSFDEIVWAVLPENDTLTSLVEYLGRRADELFENTPTRCWFTAPSELPHITVPAEVRHSFYLACKEALHNVTKHSQAKEVRVRVTVQPAALHVEIEDDGCGFDAAANAALGNGLRNLRKRFTDLGGRFTLETKPGAGTKVSLTIPLKPGAQSARANP
jgi:ligand-binding sensor domain-containing protein/signal transduction histidine kinase